MNFFRSAAPACLIFLLVSFAGGEPESASGKGAAVPHAAGGLVIPGSPYRYVVLNPGVDVRMPTIVLRIKRGDGRIDRWWRLRGRYFLTADSEGRAVGLSANERTLVLQRFSSAYPPRRTGFAVLNTAIHLSHPLRPGEDRPEHAVRRIEVPGSFGLRAVSDDGTMAVLDRYPPGAPRPVAAARELDLARGKLLPRAEPFLAFVRKIHGPGIRSKVVGHSIAGRPIELFQIGNPKWGGELLVFGCVHGDECAASGIEPISTALTAGCPDPRSDIYFVPNLDPDGEHAGSRLNARGVDLNRNFGSEWQPIGSRWRPEFAGPRPFSEPESRLASRIVKQVRPATTIWFHQFRGERPFVRAWGRSIEGARRFARLARMSFRAMRWPAGTAPNWQNHNFDGAAFVVELPQGKTDSRMRERLGTALVRMGRWVRED